MPSISAASAAAAPRGTALPCRAGIGLKPQHVSSILAQRPPLGFVEVHAENYMGAGGPFHDQLDSIRQVVSLSLHGVGLSLGGESPIDPRHLDRLAAVIRRFQPAVFSEHLAWSGHAGVFLNDLLPMVYDELTLARVCRHIDQVQHALGVRMLVENPATYLEFEASVLGEAQFIAEIVHRTGCGLLLDVNNAHVGCANRGADARAFIDALPLGAIGEIHVAGFTTLQDAAGAPLLIDDHGSAVDAAVWSLLRHVLAQTGPLPVLMEWDTDVPPLDVLLAQAERAQVEIDGCVHAGRLRQHEAIA